MSPTAIIHSFGTRTGQIFCDTYMKRHTCDVQKRIESVLELYIERVDVGTALFR